MILDRESVRRRLRKLDELLQRPDGLGGMSRAAGQRNILVHLHLEVDPEEVYATLARDLDAFGAFAERIDEVLEKGADR